jgi:hypothetical protein
VVSLAAAPEKRDILLGKGHMSGGQQHNLWFVNGSVRSGKVCVYHDKSNVKSNDLDLDVLAWMLTGANPSVVVQFTWTIDYNFAWFNYESPRSQEFKPADLSTTNSIVLSHNQYGFYFQQPQSVSVNQQLLISEDDSLPSVNNAVVGIGMHDAGTFGAAVTPNNKLTFTPATKLSYWISFGQYTFEVNDPLIISTLNNPGKISFPYGVYTMTATLNQDNTWTIKVGQPSQEVVAQAQASRCLHYEAGKGVMLESNLDY